MCRHVSAAAPLDGPQLTDQLTDCLIAEGFHLRATLWMIWRRLHRAPLVTAVMGGNFCVARRINVAWCAPATLRHLKKKQKNATFTLRTMTNIFFILIAWSYHALAGGYKVGRLGSAKR